MRDDVDVVGRVRLSGSIPEELRQVPVRHLSRGEEIRRFTSPSGENTRLLWLLHGEDLSPTIAVPLGGGVCVGVVVNHIARENGHEHLDVRQLLIRE